MSENFATYLCIDHGNTALKFAVFQNREILGAGQGLEELKQYLEKTPVDKAIVASVGKAETLNVLNSLVPKLHILSEKSNLPIKNTYATPKTLGQDRLANAVAASFLAKNSPALIVDAGTCLKFDFVDGIANYCGGSIAPGLRMRFRALHHFTAALPNLENISDLQQYHTDFIGQSTNNSIAIGVYNGMCNEINETIRRYSDQYEDLTIFLTGGDAQHFENAINYRIFAASNLTLLGLSLILELNE